ASPRVACAPSTRAIARGEPARAGRWWWESNAPKECGIHCAIETGGFEHELPASLRDAHGGGDGEAARRGRGGGPRRGPGGALDGGRPRAPGPARRPDRGH